MRELTPSADDTPKRAPPAPPREADVAASKATGGPTEFYQKLRLSSTVSGTMVASTNNLEDLGVSHPANASIEIRQQQQQQQGHACKSALTTQDKRSRLSNVINNLRKKVPEPKCESSSCAKDDDKSSVERNLETLEKYVMTVLNGVIKDQEENNRESSPEKFSDSAKINNMKGSNEGSVRQGDDSKDCENRLEPSIPADEEAKLIPTKGTSENLRSFEEEKKDLNISKVLTSEKESLQSHQFLESLELREETSIADQEGEIKKREEVNREEEEAEKKSRTLGIIIMQRLMDHQDQKDAPKEAEESHKMAEETSKKVEESSKENSELQRVCTELLNDILNDIVQSVQQTESKDSKKEIQKLVRTSGSMESLTTSLHCSLPLEKVASVLQACQSPENGSQITPKISTKTSAKAASPTVRHLCLYCDRKFLSISLRQRHTERVHQLGGGRRSERNSKKSSQNCQYCSDKCVESLEGLFQHMVGNHGDKYHACLQCVTRYPTREALINHTNETHNISPDRTAATSESLKETPSVKELMIPPREKVDISSKDKRVKDDFEFREGSSVIIPKAINKDVFSNPGSPEFDSSFYSSVSCNIRENLLHHLDGKLHANSTPPSNSSTVDLKPPSCYEQSSSQMQFPIDISHTAITPVYNKEYSSEEFDNSSEYAQKPKKNSRSHPRRVSFEKYNFPRKYDGKEQWTCSIKDLSKFDISTQLSLRKKQQLVKESNTLSRLNQIPILGSSKSDVVQTEFSRSDEESSSSSRILESVKNTKAGNSSEESLQGSNDVTVDQETQSSNSSSELSTSKSTEFLRDFGSFLELRKLDDSNQNSETSNNVVYAELTGEWSRPRIYICGACASKQETLKEMEDHKTAMHPNVWCSHYEFSGDQLELYKHLFLPGKSLANSKAKNVILPEKICTKCFKNCSSLAELHKHMLECGGDQAWLLGLFGNGKKKCKWRPFGSRSRRRRNRGMKRNIQNSQTPRINVPKEKQPAGPRVRPSDRESIQKMLANLPLKRATRKVLQDNAARSQGRLRKVQTKARSSLVETSSTRLSRNKAVLRNKLLKNAKSFQRKLCRNDNISAAIETVVGYDDQEKIVQDTNNTNKIEDPSETSGRPARMVRNVKVLSKRKTIKTKESIIRNVEQSKTRTLKSKSDMAVEAFVTRSTLKGENSKINDPVITKGKSNIAKLISQSPANGTSSATSLKKKKTVDPIASMNASMKARSQLRTNDGKFARSPLKIAKPFHKPDDSIESLTAPQIMKKRGKGSSVSCRFLRSKLKAAQHVMKDAVKTSRRNSRLSSDKMPMLESEADSSTKEESLEKSTVDFPILSPVISTSQPKGLRSSSRNSSLGRKSEGSKEKTQNKADLPTEEEEIEVEDNNKSEEGKGKRLKKIVRKGKEINDVKELKEFKEVTEVQELKETKDENIFEKLESSSEREVRGRPKKSLPAKIAGNKDLTVCLKKFSSSSITKNKEDESNNAESETVVTKRDEVTKSLETRNRRSKQQVVDSNQIVDIALEGKRLSGPKEDLLKNLGLKSTKTLKKNIKSSKSKNGSEDSDSTPEAGTKKEKFNAMRKSPRTAEKNLTLDDSDKSTDLPNSDEASKPELTENTKLNSEEQSIDSNVSESNKKISSLEATPSTSQNKIVAKRKKRSETLEKESEAPVDEEEIPIEIEVPDAKENEIISKHLETPELMNLSLENIQQESCNSNMDSGKENSLEMSMNFAKLKVVRPKKTRNSRKERTSKRSLNNVIGILTEGINIPIEAQESVVLTLQTSVEIANPDNAFQNNEELQTENNLTSESTETMSNLDLNEIQNSSEKPEIGKSNEDEPKTCGSNENLELTKITETTSNDPPANDIILDLSRRKPKGKGSFLERIVSKIAKKKDVLLEGDASFSLESVNKCSENVEMNQSTDKIQENPQSSVPEKSDTQDSSVEKGENKGEIKSTRKSKKRSLEVNSPKKNKRKIITEVPEEVEVEKELCFGDIMSLVQKSAVPVEDTTDDQMIGENTIRCEKEEAAIMDSISLNNEASINENQDIEANIETSRKSKRKSKNENFQDQDLNNSLSYIPGLDEKESVGSQKETRKSSKRSINQENVDKLDELSSVEEELKLENKSAKVEELLDVQSVFESSNLLLNIDKLLLNIEGSDDSLESKYRRTKNLAEEHLELSDDDTVLKPLSEKVYEFFGESDDSESVEFFKRPRKRSSIEMDKESNSDMFKIPNAFGTNKRSSKRKSLVNENFESMDDLSSEDISASESTSLASEDFGDKSTKRRYPKRRHIVNTFSESEDDMSTDSFSTTLKSSRNEESNIGKRQTPGRKAKQNISLVDEHFILPDDEFRIQEDQSLQEESFGKEVEITLSTSTEKKRPGRKAKNNLVDLSKSDNELENAKSSGISEEQQNILEVISNTSVEKRRAGRKPKKNVSLIIEDLSSEDATGTDNEMKNTLEKAVEEKLCEGIQTQLKRSEHMFVSNLEKARPGRKSKKNISLSEEHLLLDDDRPTMKKGEEKNKEINPVDEIQEPTFLETQSSPTEKKRPGRKSKKNIVVDEISIRSQQKDDIGEKKSEELLKSLEEPKIPKVNQSKSEKKRPGRKPKKNSSLLEVHHSLSDDIVLEDYTVQENINQNPQQLMVTEEVENHEKPMEGITQNQSPEKKRPGRKLKSLSSQDFVERGEEKAVEKLVGTIVKSKSFEIEINQTNFKTKRNSRKSRKNIFEEDPIPLDETIREESLPEVNKTIALNVEKVDEAINLQDREVPIKESESLERKRPGRKAKKNIYLVDEHLNLYDDFSLQNDVLEEINLVDKSIDVTNERKRLERKPKKNVSESSSFITVSKKPEEELEIQNPAELENILSEEPQTSEIGIRSSSLEKKRPGRKPKKNVCVVDDYVFSEDSEQKDHSGKVEREINYLSQKDSDQFSEIGPKLQVIEAQNVEKVEKVEKKRPGRKSKKDTTFLHEYIIHTDNNTTQNQEPNYMPKNKDQSEKSDVPAFQNECPEKKRPGRKSKKHASLLEYDLILSDKIIETGEKVKSIVAEKESDAVIQSITEVSTSNTSLEKKRPGRKAKKNISLLDEYMDLLDEVETVKEKTHFAKDDSGKESSLVEIRNKKVSEESKTLEANTTGSESPERKRKTLKRKSKNMSLLDEHLSLSDEDKIEEKEDFNEKTYSSSNSKKETDQVSEDVSSTLESITAMLEKEVNQKSSLIDEHLNLGDSFKEQEFTNEDEVKSAETKTHEVREQESNAITFEKEASLQRETETSLEPDSNQELQNHELQNHEPSESKESLADDFQTPKKRPAGNFAVVHTKSGEILIVEKKKKLTKEAAKFFCDICATSFTRKSSLKKHNLSQSHLIQINHTSGKENEKGIPTGNEENIFDDKEKAENLDDEVEEKMEESLLNNENLEKTEELSIEPAAESLDILNEHMDQHFKEMILVPEERSQIPLPTSTEAPEENMEDELLDEEICKITENMTHDEYVLTDHISPVFPEAASTPIKTLEAKAEINEIITSKKKNKNTKSRKKNLADEHLDLDTPEPNFDTSTESQTSLDNVLNKSSKFIIDIPAVEQTEISLSDIASELNVQKPGKQLEIETIINKEANISDEIKTHDSTKKKRKARKQNTEEENIIESTTNVENSFKRVSLRFGRNEERKEETSRPKRNQHKQNYREYEAFDFEQDELDLEISMSKWETLKSRKTTAISRESSRSKKNQEDEDNKEEEGFQSTVEKRTRRKSKKDEQNEDNEQKEEIETSETLTASLIQILGTKNESDSTVKILDAGKIQDSLPSSFEDNLKSSSKIEISKLIYNDDDDLKLDFLNVEESLKTQKDKAKFKTKDSVITEFDSDDNSLNTDMSVDIQKLLDDPELSIDNNISQTASKNDNILGKAVESSFIEKEILNFTEIEGESSRLIENNEIDNKPEDIVPEEIENKTKNKIETEIPQMTEHLNEKNETVTREVFETNPQKQPKASKPEKGSGKAHKAKSKQKKVSSKTKITELDRSELSDNEYIAKSENKNKIVRSVFGRVFGGEKVDKVKEVLDDWNSKSESSDNELNKSKEADSLKLSRGASKQRKDAKKNFKRRSRNSSASGSTSRGTSQKRKSVIDSQEDDNSLPSKHNISRNSSKTGLDEDQLKTNKVETSFGTSELLITSSRCRQSKMRAEERISTISRAFDESPISDEDHLNKSQKGSKNKEASHEFKNQVKIISGQKDWKEIFTGEKTCASKKTDDFDLPLETDFKLNESLSQIVDRESVSSMASSLKSQSPVSQLSQNSEDEEIEDDILRRRMSPFFDYNNSYTSLGSSTNSNNEGSEEEVDYIQVSEKQEICRKSCSSEFSGEKIVIRSPLANHENRVEVVTIAPTDAIEDNALDVPQEIVSATAAMSSTALHKSRQGKVLNFDQELFVECCSRLKATTEKELRGAKKIKLDHSETYRKEDPTQIFRSSKDRWRDVESQNSLGSLLDSVNQLLGEEMYSNNEKDNQARDNGSERSSRSASPDTSRADNLGYEDSLDVAFEHNNKLRDKIQQRMRESENLISNTFGQKSNNGGELQHKQFMQREDREESVHVYGRVQNQFSVPNLNVSNGIYESGPHKGNSSLHGGLLDKALSNLLHNNGKHDHNGSNPMKVLAELACARVPTSTASIKLPRETIDSLSNATNQKELLIKKPRNPIKELFERKRELYERKQIEKCKTDVISKPSNSQKSRKIKKTKKRQEFPLIRNDHHDGLAERKKRRDVFEKRKDLDSTKAKDVYDFEDEESQIEPAIGSVLSYRSKFESTDFKEKSVDMSNLMSKTIGDALENGKTGDSLSRRLTSMIDHKFKDIEKFAPKTKGALKSFQSEDKLITGPMDEFIERKKNTKRVVEQRSKHLKLKKKSKSTKKKSRNAWYENDSSDEFITAAKAEDVGVGISKSQRTCSKGKQNLFAELSSSSESETVIEEVEEKEENLALTQKEEKNDDNSETEDKVSEKVEKNIEIGHKKSLDDTENKDYHWSRNSIHNFESNSESDSESESELIIDLKKDSEENNESENEEPEGEDNQKYDEENKARDENQSKKEWIPLEEALNLLDQHDNLDGISKEIKKIAKVSRAKSKRTESESSDKFNKDSKENHSPIDEQETPDDDLPILPEKLTTNEKPQKEPDNLPLHVFLSRKVQESKKRKQQQRKNKRLQQASISDFEPIRRQRKCAIGKQGLLAEISSSDEEIYTNTPSRRSGERAESERPRKQKKESKEKRKERYIEKKHEQMIAKEQKAIEEEILRELGKNKTGQSSKNSEDQEVNKMEREEYEEKIPKRKHQKQKSFQDEEIENDSDSEPREKKLPKSNQRSKKSPKSEVKVRSKIDKPKSRRNSVSMSKDPKERRLSSNKRDSGDEELRTTKSWNKVDEAVGVAIGRRKRAAVNQLYYWSSSSDEEEKIEAAPVVEEEDDRLEQHGWIVGDSHKKMITMLAMEKQLKEKRRRSEDEFESGKGKNKKHRNSTS